MLDPSNGSALGPTPSVLNAYRELQTALNADVDPEFHPGFVAEYVGRRIDSGDLLYGWQPKVDGELMSYQTYWHMGLQTFGASVLGLRMHPLQKNRNAWTVVAKRGLRADIPDVQTLPRLKNGKMVDPVTGQALSAFQADTAWARHYLINHRAAFTQPRDKARRDSGPFERLFVRTLDQIDKHSELVVAPGASVEEQRGRCSVRRATARILGYTSVGAFKPDNKGNWHAPITGDRLKGFDTASSAYAEADRVAILGR